MRKHKHYKKNYMWDKFVKHMRRTWINKVAVLAMLALTYWAGKWTGDATAFAFMLVFFGPVFFMNENCFNF